MDHQSSANLDDPLQMLEELRSRNDSRKCRLFAVACCRRIWHHIPEKLHSAVIIAEHIANGQGDDLRVKTAEEVKLQCIYVDGDSPAIDRVYGFAAEAVLSSLFGDDDYPPIPTYATTCAIAAARAVQEVVYADRERLGCPPEQCEQALNAERRWQFAKLQQMFDAPPKQAGE